MRIVVVNSIGPMASTVVGSVVEKFGYLNIPVRKIGLHDYLLGKRDLKDDFLKSRIVNYLKSHNQIVQSGGVSVQDRNSSPPRQLVDMAYVEKEIEVFKNKSFSNVAEMYGYGRNLYSRALKYKVSNHIDGNHIEYTTDVQNYKAGALYQSYKTEFNDVYMINLHRDFSGWLDSLVSQRFTHPTFRIKYFFVFHSAFNLYDSYEKAIKDMPGLHLDFDKLFIPHHSELINQISVFLKAPVPAIQWEMEQYDLFGKLSDYQKTFTKADNKTKYLSSFTHAVIRKFIRSGKITIVHDAIVYFLYLCDLTIYQFKRRKS